MELQTQAFLSFQKANEQTPKIKADNNRLYSPPQQFQVYQSSKDEEQSVGLSSQREQIQYSQRKLKDQQYQLTQEKQQEQLSQQKGSTNEACSQLNDKALQSQRDLMSQTSKIDQEYEELQTEQNQRNNNNNSTYSQQSQKIDSPYKFKKQAQPPQFSPLKDNAEKISYEIALNLKEQNEMMNRLLKKALQRHGGGKDDSDQSNLVQSHSKESNQLIEQNLFLLQNRRKFGEFNEETEQEEGQMLSTLDQREKERKQMMKKTKTKVGKTEGGVIKIEKKRTQSQLTKKNTKGSKEGEEERVVIEGRGYILQDQEGFIGNNSNYFSKEYANSLLMRNSYNQHKSIKQRKDIISVGGVIAGGGGVNQALSKSKTKHQQQLQQQQQQNNKKNINNRMNQIMEQYKVYQSQRFPLTDKNNQSKGGVAYNGIIYGLQNQAPQQMHSLSNKSNNNNAVLQQQSKDEQKQLQVAIAQANMLQLQQHQQINPHQPGGNLSDTLRGTSTALSYQTFNNSLIPSTSTSQKQNMTAYSGAGHFGGITSQFKSPYILDHLYTQQQQALKSSFINEQSQRLKGNAVNEQFISSNPSAQVIPSQNQSTNSIKHKNYTMVAQVNLTDPLVLNNQQTAEYINSIGNFQQPSTGKKFKPYKYQIMPGNNSQLVRRVIEQSERSWYWTENTNTSSSHFHFRWAPVSKQVNFERLSHNFIQMVNHYEGHSEISKKHELFKNMKLLLDENNENVFKLMPLTFFLKINMEKPLYSIKQQLQAFKYVFKLFEEFKPIFDQEPTGVNNMNNKVIGGTGAENRTPSLEELIASGNVSFISKDANKDTFDINGNKFITLYGQSHKRTADYLLPLNHFKGKNVWILKPTCLNRGKGIHVISSMKKLKRLIRDYCRGKDSQQDQQQAAQKNAQQQQDHHAHYSHYQSQNMILGDQQQYHQQQTNNFNKNHYVMKHNMFILQKYIEEPLLINKRKFDIRVWVLLTQDYDVYFFKEGYLRTSSNEYTTEKGKLDDDFIHLTNNAVQKNAPGYGTHEDGNQLSFPDFKKYLKTNQFSKSTQGGISSSSSTPFHSNDQSNVFENDILPKMKYYAALSMLATRKKLNLNKRKQCFELFGYDYIIDSDFNVFLIEANTNPCIEESSSILKKLIPRMINDALKLTIDQIYPPPLNIQPPPSFPFNQTNYGTQSSINYVDCMNNRRESNQTQQQLNDFSKQNLTLYSHKVQQSEQIMSSSPIKSTTVTRIEGITSQLDSIKEQSSINGVLHVGGGSGGSQLDKFTFLSSQFNIDKKGGTESSMPRNLNQSDQLQQKESLKKRQLNTFSVPGYTDTENMWEKIAILKGGAAINGQEKGTILVEKPKKLLNSNRLLHIVNHGEMRLIRPEIIEGELRSKKAFINI